MFIDTHCHLDFPEFDKDREQVIQAAKQAGVDYIINIGSSLEGSKKSVALAKEHTDIYVTVGIHPHEADSFNEQKELAIRELLREEKVVAIGEIGLDYFLPAGRQGKNYSQPQNQKILFKSLLGIAKDSGLPLVLHIRQAQTEVLEIIKDNLPLKAVVHCFSGDEDFLRKCLELSFFISFTCNITYPKAQNLRNLVKVTPLERLLLETDAPFLAPQELRGRRNEPAFVKLLAQEIAKLKAISLDEVASVTTANAKQFFNLR